MHEEERLKKELATVYGNDKSSPVDVVVRREFKKGGYMQHINCPYCRHAQEICHDDGYGYGEGEIYQQECSHCEKFFAFTTSITLDYDVKKADCLNGADHPFEPSQTYPKEYTKMVCSICGSRRDLTKAEMDAMLSA